MIKLKSNDMIHHVNCYVSRKSSLLLTVPVKEVVRPEKVCPEQNTAYMIASTTAQEV